MYWWRSLVTVLFILCSSSVFAQYHFTFNEECDAAYNKLMMFKIDEGTKQLDQIYQKDQHNLIPVMLANYEDFLLLMFNGDPNYYAKNKKNLDTRIALLDKGPHHSPWKKYTKANVYFQWALVQMRFGDNISAATNMRKSFLLLKENAQQYPNFIYNNVIYGFEEAVLGTFPDKYKWITNILGMSGSVVKGTNRIVKYLNTRDGSAKYLRAEAVFYYTYIRFNLLSDPEGTWQYMNASKLNIKDNMMYTFMKANYALTDNKATVAINTLLERNNSSAYTKMPLLDYWLGLAYFYNQDERCVQYMNQFLRNYKGNLYAKHAQQIKSLYYYTTGNIAKAKEEMNAIITIGNTTIDADKQANRFAQAGAFPHVSLLKVRMAMDGGYFDKALNYLQSIKVDDLEVLADQVEYYYRYARVYAKTNKMTNAIQAYQKTIDLGSGQKTHFAARSALELAQYFEKMNQNEKAKTYYNKALAMKGHDYKESIDQKAKAGLSRLK